MWHQWPTIHDTSALYLYICIVFATTSAGMHQPSTQKKNIGLSPTITISFLVIPSFSSDILFVSFSFLVFFCVGLFQCSIENIVLFFSLCKHSFTLPTMAPWQVCVCVLHIRCILQRKCGKLAGERKTQFMHLHRIFFQFNTQLLPPVGICHHYHQQNVLLLFIYLSQSSTFR